MNFGEPVREFEVIPLVEPVPSEPAFVPIEEPSPVPPRKREKEEPVPVKE